MKRIIWVIGVTLVLCAFVQSAFAQATGDTTKPTHIKELRPGISLADSLYIPADSVRGDVDTIVRYTAKDSAVFDVPNKRMILTNNAVVQYQNRELDAYTIVMDFQNNTMTAYSYDVDSVISSSLALRRRIIRDTNRVKVRGAPKLTEGGTTYEGEVIVYNFKTKHGTVQLGTTEMEGGFYYGEKIKQVAPQTLFVQNGRYTTCDAPVPHYYFESPKMKVVMQSQIFAEPVYLYVADVPIFALPFAVFPNHGGGRHSGIVAPGYQTTGDRGYGLTHFGYYDVFSDYFDARLQADVFTKGGWNVDALAEWMKRYLLNGAASIHAGYGYTRFNSVDPFQQNWLVEAVLPNLMLGYETSLSSNLHFENDGYFQNNAHNEQELFRQSVNSNASFNTGWEDLGLSLGIDYQRTQDLLLKTYSETSPSINFSKATFFPFAATEGETVDPTLASLAIGYNLSASRSVTRGMNGNTSEAPTDTTTWYNTEQYSVLHNPSISISPKLGHFSITPRFGYQEAWLFHQHHRAYGITTAFDSVTHGNDTSVYYTQSTEDGFHRLYSYSGGIGISTTLYGIANIGAFGIQAVRHTISPTISVSYQPDLSFQNYVPYTDPRTGQKGYYNIFDGEPNGGIVGFGKSAQMSMGIDNYFEAKVEHQVTKDSSTVDHLKLFRVNASSSYDLTTKVLGNLNFDFSSQIGTLFSVGGNAGYSFYPVDSLGNILTNQTLIALHQGYLRPLNASATINGSFSSSTTTEGENYDSLRRQFNIGSPEDERAFMLGGYFPGPFVSVPFRPTWNATYGLSYSQYYATTGTTRNFSVTSSFSFSLTKNWSFTTSASYDLVNKKVIVPELHVHRDLHCWEMDLSYRPPGSLISGFNFVIRVKAPQLQDVKLTRTENTYGEF